MNWLVISKRAARVTLSPPRLPALLGSVSAQRTRSQAWQAEEFETNARSRAWRRERIADCNTNAFQKAVTRAKLAPLRWHDLRHTFASWAIQSGVAPHELMQLGGWASYSMVLRYAHLAPDHLAAAAEKVARTSHENRHARKRTEAASVSA
ncbi:MAG: tyrosine-type recombinase/integrase [Steroidobacteraceae bacterium]|jgi:integrase